MKLGIQIDKLNATAKEKEKWQKYINELNADLKKKVEESKYVKY